MKLWIDKAAWTSARVRRTIHSLRTEEVHSIAVVKHAAFGDMVLTRPFFVELRRHFPAAKITLSLARHYMRGAPTDLVDRTHISDGTLGPEEGLRSAHKSYVALGWHDLLFDLTASARSRWITFLNGSALKVGFSSADSSFLLGRFLYDVLVPRTDSKFEAETFLDQLHVLGFDSSWPPDFGIVEAPVTGAPRCIVYFPTASVQYKCWPIDSFLRLIEKLTAEFPRHEHVILAGVEEWERRIAEELAARCKEQKNVRLHPPDLDLIRNAHLLISNDTGIRNYAIATGTPTVGIFFSTNPFRYRPRFGRHAVVFLPDGSMPVVDDVYGEARRLLFAPEQGGRRGEG